MPSSSGKKNKHPQHSKKSKAIQRQRSGVTPAPRTVPDSPSVSPTAEVAPSPVSSVATAASPRTTVSMEYPYLGSELKRIGILAAVIIIILIILAIVLG